MRSGVAQAVQMLAEGAHALGIRDTIAVEWDDDRVAQAAEVLQCTGF